MKKSSWMTIVPTVICAIALLILGYYCGKTKTNIKQIDTVTVSDTIWKDTTIVEKELVPKEVIKKKVDTVYTKQGDTLNLITESKRYDRSLVSNKDTVDVEIYTTGINTSLDSLKWRLKTHNEIITNTIEITRYKKKLITTSPSVTLGYDPLNKQWGAMIGMSLNLHIW
jgi:hypothetical protein